jgi:hypothetical protein
MKFTNFPLVEQLTHYVKRYVKLFPIFFLTVLFMVQIRCRSQNLSKVEIGTGTVKK